MANKVERDPVSIMQEQARRRVNRLSRWIGDISAAVDAKGGAGIAVTFPEQQAEIIEALEHKAGGPNNVLKIDGRNTVEGSHDPRTDTTASSLISFELAKEEKGLIIVEGIDALGTMKRGAGNPHITKFLSELALWKRTQYPRTIPRMPVVAIGIVSVSEEAHLAGNVVRRTDMGSSFVDVLDAHFLVDQSGDINPLLFMAVNPRMAGFGLGSRSRSANTGFTVNENVANSRVETRLP